MAGGTRELLWAWMVSATKVAIWGQTRGWRVEQIMTPTEGEDDMVSVGR